MCDRPGCLYPQLAEGQPYPSDEGFRTGHFAAEPPEGWRDAGILDELRHTGHQISAASRGRLVEMLDEGAAAKAREAVLVETLLEAVRTIATVVPDVRLHNLDDAESRLTRTGQRIRTVLEGHVPLQPHRYNPDAMAMGDCRECGNVFESPIHAAADAADRASLLRTDLTSALERADAQGDSLRRKAQRTAISNEDWRYTNGYDAALKHFEPVRRLLDHARPKGQTVAEATGVATGDEMDKLRRIREER